MRPAFTIVELLVAIVVLSVGVIALAATAGLVAAHVGDGARLTGAAHAARSAIDSIAAAPCAKVVDGAEAAGVGTVQWEVRRDTLAAQVELTTRSPLRRRAHQQAYRLLVPCSEE